MFQSGADFGSPSRQSPVVNTIFSFVDREATLALNEKSTTATELAKLYAHVQAMPESRQKKKLVCSPPIAFKFLMLPSSSFFLTPAPYSSC